MASGTFAFGGAGQASAATEEAVGRGRTLCGSRSGAETRQRPTGVAPTRSKGGGGAVLACGTRWHCLHTDQSACGQSDFHICNDKI